MRRITVGFLMVVLSLAGISSWAQSDNSAGKIDIKKLKIGVSMYTLDAPYFAAQMASAKAEIERLGAKCVTTNAQGSMTKQIADIEDLLAQQIDLLLLNPLDPKGLVTATKEATKAKVPVIIIDSSIDPTADFVTTVQSNNSENGFAVGEWLGKKMGNTAVTIALISGAKGNPVGQARRDGVFTGLTEYQLRTFNNTTFKVVAQGWGNWAQEGGLNAMEDILTAHPEINVLLTENDSMALGAMKAIEASGKQGKILIVAAADGQKEALALIKKGNYGATGLNDPALIAKTAVTVGIQYLQGKRDFTKVTFTQPAAITKENVDQYYNPSAVF
jgi:ribose transport system substrate-binding protein